MRQYLFIIMDLCGYFPGSVKNDLNNMSQIHVNNEPVPR